MKFLEVLWARNWEKTLHHIISYYCRINSCSAIVGCSKHPWSHANIGTSQVHTEIFFVLFCVINCEAFSEEADRDLVRTGCWHGRESSELMEVKTEDWRNTLIWSSEPALEVSSQPWSPPHAHPRTERPALKSPFAVQQTLSGYMRSMLKRSSHQSSKASRKLTSNSSKHQAKF
jgi:hypothetical protein